MPCFVCACADMSKVARTKIDTKEHYVSNINVVTAIALPNRNSISQHNFLALLANFLANTASFPGNILFRHRRWIGPLPLTSWRPAMPALLPAMPLLLSRSHRHRNVAQFVPFGEWRDAHWELSLVSSTCRSKRGNAATASSLPATAIATATAKTQSACQATCTFLASTAQPILFMSHIESHRPYNICCV